MATSGFHRLIMEKVEIGSVFFYHDRDIWTFFTEMLIEVCPVYFCKTFVRIVEFDWLPGRKKG